MSEFEKSMARLAAQERRNRRVRWGLLGVALVLTVGGFILIDQNRLVTGLLMVPTGVVVLIWWLMATIMANANR